MPVLACEVPDEIRAFVEDEAKERLLSMSDIMREILLRAARERKIFTTSPGVEVAAVSMPAVIAVEVGGDK